MLSTLIVQLVFASIDIEIVDNLVKEVKKKRIGLIKKDIKNPFENYTKSSFKKEQKIQITKVAEFRLSAIINNMVKINNRWYKIGSSINNYKITAQNNQCVELQNSSNKIKVCIKKGKNTLFSTYKKR